MKVFGVVVVVLGILLVYIGVTGSQHRLMDILKGVHLAPNPGGNSSLPNPGKGNTITGGSVNLGVT